MNFLTKVSLLCLLSLLVWKFLLCRSLQFLQPVADVFYHEKEIVKNINWVCYNQSLNDFKIYDFENIKQLVHDSDVFNPECHTILYIGGLSQQLDAGTTITILTSYLKIKQQCPNICQFNYTRYSRQNSATKSFFAVDKVGASLATMAEKLFTSGVDRNKFSCVGHSLGGQVCGAFGRHTEPKFQRILALDPAGPGFHVALKNVGKGQAQCVVCIHTDDGYYGMKLAKCDIDIYPNGGTRLQPGCPTGTRPLSLTPEDTCSHHRSVNYTANALLRPELFLLVKCELTKPWQRRNRYECDDKNPIKLTELWSKCLNERLHGKFYCRTSGKEPYGLGMEGVKTETFTFL